MAIEYLAKESKVRKSDESVALVNFKIELSPEEEKILKEMEKMSLRKFEHVILPQFRNRISNAESSEDIKKIFSSMVIELFEKAFKERFSVEYDDVIFKPNKQPYYSLSQRLLKEEPIRSILKKKSLGIKIGGEYVFKHSLHGFRR